MIRWKALIRDAVIIFVLTGLGGFVIGLASAGSDLPMAAVGVSNIIFMIVGFTISGCIVRRQRFRHLLHVALAVWLLGAFNMLFPAIGLVQWLASIIVIAVSMLIGGGISHIFVKAPEEQDSQQQLGQVSSDDAPSDEPSS